VVWERFVRSAPGDVGLSDIRPFADKADERDFAEHDVYFNNDFNSVRRRARIPAHDYFGQILDSDGTVLLCLHEWGAHELPSLMSPDHETPGNGLLLFFRVDDFDPALQRARSLVTRLEEEPHVKPLRYSSFESALRYISRRAGISVHPHLLRHTLAQGVLETTGNIKVAQEILRHSHLSTTADLYLRVDQNEMVRALVAAKSSTERTTKRHSWPSAKAAQYAFAYDDETIVELERAMGQVSGSPADVRRAPRTRRVELADGDS